VTGSVQPEGDRLHSYTKDHNINLKAGYIADDKSEIAINYLNQKGEKEHPVSVDKQLSKELFRDSPMWDKEIISISGLKNFGSSYMKSLVYYNKSENLTSEFKDKTYSVLKLTTRYDDYSYGARLEYGIETNSNLLKLVANYKKDVHKAYETEPATPTKNTEHFEEHTSSIGAEDNYYIRSDLEILAGVSYDRLKADKVYYPEGYQGLDTISAFNPQAALIYTFTPQSKIKVSASQKTHLPTMKERYSGGSSTKAPNPDLDKEIANHYEIAYTYKTQKFLVNTNFYYSKVKDAIEAVVYVPDPTLKQNQNIGDFEHKGAEFDITYQNDNTKVGGNYAFVDVKNKRDSSVKETNLPKHQLFAYVEQKLGAGFSFYVNSKFRNGVYNQITNGTYVEMDSFTTFDTKLIYAYMDSLKFEAGVKNLTDELVEYNLGYPEAGREYFATMYYKF